MRHADLELYRDPDHGAPHALRDQLAKTPWWMISIALHAVFVMLAYMVMFDAAPVTKVEEILTKIEEPEKDPFDDPIPDEVEQPRDIESEDPIIDDPVIRDVEESDHNENDVNDDQDSMKGDNNDAMSDRPLQGRFWNTAIGVGGGASGALGDARGGNRDLKARIGGGGRATELAVESALRWLVNHQDRTTGAWSCPDFAACCKKNVCDGKGSNADYTPGTTSLALLAFLGAGHSIQHGRYREVVKRGVHYLRSIQTPDGCIGPKTADGHYIYNHAIGTMALAEAYGLSNRNPMLRGPAQQAVDFLLAAQNPYLGWRYGIRPGDNDTSVTGWAVLALKSALLSELNVPPEGFAGAKSWIEKATDDSFFKTGYTQKGDNGARPSGSTYRASEAMTAAGLASRIFMGASGNDAAVRGAADLLKNQPPKWEPGSGTDFYYWYYGTLAMFQLGGEHWRAWNTGMKEALVKTQRRGGCEDGSWDPLDAWGSEGGRVYATAINCLSLEIYYRYSRVLKDK